MKKIILLVTLLSALFVSSQEYVKSVSKIVIKIPLGETIQLKNGSVKFVEVLEDSRCPIYVNCIWAGRAKVLAEVTEKGKETVQKVLLFGELLEGEFKDNILFTTDEKRISGFDLYPLPTSNVDEEREPFELLIDIEKN